MPQISDRLQRMPSSPIRKLVPFADTAKARGTHVYHLNIGQPDIETPTEWWDAIQQADMKVLAYSHSAGRASLREAIIRYYRRLGHNIKMADVIVTTGASEALRFVMDSCLNPGDEIIVPEPFYANYNGFAIAGDSKVVPITTSIDQNFALPPIEAFEELITPKTKAILICNPGNPTGVVYGEESMKKLRDIVAKHDLYLISDEVYREFIYDGPDHYSALALEGIEENVIVTDSVSKRFSACGARIGTIISRNSAVIDACMKLAQARLAPPTMEQIGAEAVYDLPLDYYEKVKGEYFERRNFLVKALNEIPGVFCPEVNGAFYAFVRLPVEDSEHFCQWMLESFEYEGATTMMAPGAGFYASPDLGKDEVRMAYVLNNKDLAKAIKCLAEGLKAYKNR
ncbi:MAG: pyridoxal phosphate-dependent aminotransferase [Bacteroidia bacterium]